MSDEGPWTEMIRAVGDFARDLDYPTNIEGGNIERTNNNKVWRKGERDP